MRHPLLMLAAACLVACGVDSPEIAADAGFDTTDAQADTDAATGADADASHDTLDLGTVDAEVDTTELPGFVVEPPNYPAYASHPEPPSVLRDVALIDDDAQFTRPYVPGNRTTMDGRVALRVQGGPPGGPMLSTQLSFWLFVPERLQSPIMSGPAGAQILARTEPVNVTFPPALAAGVERLGHHAICDVSSDFPVEGERPNPYVCGEGSGDDCYDFVVVSTTSRGTTSQFWGTPVHVQVANPKTADAEIVEVTLGESTAGIQVTQMSEFTEPAVTSDGRLLTGRLGRAPRSWTNPETGETIVRPIELAYSRLQDGFEPCDVRGWQQFHPMSHAPYDPGMVATYGLAAHPFRDSEGNLIADGEDLGGTYPWVDRQGTNVFMAGVQGRISEQSHDRYPRRCIVEGCDQFEENNDWDRGFLVGGLWTHGRFVHIDAMNNNMDWAVGVEPQAHWMVELYRQADETPVEIRFGGGRFIDALRGSGPYPPGYTHNANILDSLQNLHNANINTFPITPRDIVWTMSTGVATDEVAFDDMLDVNALIVSNMQASITQHYNAQGESVSVPHHWNGTVRELLFPVPLAEAAVLHPEDDEEVHIQNGATSVAWNVPPFGLVPAGGGRTEPVALGGVIGRGFWSTGDAGITYSVPEQTVPLSERELHVSVFVDRRDAGEERVLITFPDATSIRMIGADTVRYVWRDRVVHDVTLPGPVQSGWLHLGWGISVDRRTVTLMVNGFAYDRVNLAVPVFDLPPGELMVAGPSDGFRGVRGWIDEFKVFAYIPNVEVLCNHANGTLVEVNSESERWASVASSFPDWAHAEVAAASGRESGEFVCFHDHSMDYAANLRNIPAEAISVRNEVIFPEGPLRTGAPRPDSTSNSFCLSCHSSDGRGGLGLDALTPRPGLMLEDDPRRQPMQPPRRVFGNIPGGWIPEGVGPGSPVDSTRAPPAGLLIDAWILSSSP